LTTCVSESFIDPPIAIIIQPITVLADCTFIGGAAEYSVVTQRYAQATDTGLACGTGQTLTEVIFIHRIVAVVVHTITFFVGGFCDSLANQTANITRLNAFGAGPKETRIAEFSAIRIVLVDDSIAVIVESIASFIERFAAASAH